jgi:hypothetical protein
MLIRWENYVIRLKQQCAEVQASMLRGQIAVLEDIQARTSVRIIVLYYWEKTPRNPPMS